jgi:hypothetical protein
MIISRSNIPDLIEHTELLFCKVDFFRNDTPSKMFYIKYSTNSH